MSFWNIIWFIFVSFAFIAYLMFMFQIISDLFRDHTVSGWVKAMWMILLIFFPFLTAIIYLIVRGNGRPDQPGQGPARLRGDQPGRVRRPEGQGARLAQPRHPELLGRPAAGPLVGHDLVERVVGAVRGRVDLVHGLDHEPRTAQ